MPSLHTNRGAKAARKARERLGLQPDEPLDCLLTVVEKRAGVPVVLLPLPGGFAGAYLSRGGRALIFLAADGALSRRRFSLAHEFGHHCLCHPRRADRWEGMAIGASHPHETESNAFAAEFVAPKAAVHRALAEAGDPHIALDVVVRLAGRFGLSCEAMRYRLATCRVIRRQKLANRLDEELRADEHKRLANQLGITWPRDGLAELHGAPYRMPDGFSAATDSIAALLGRGFR
jgi:Zn-dependent peptidase ImmA (M78 family)